MGVDENWLSSSSFIVLTTRGVQTGPGATPFTWIHLLTTSVERARVNANKPLAAQLPIIHDQPTTSTLEAAIASTVSLYINYIARWRLTVRCGSQEIEKHPTRSQNYKALDWAKDRTTSDWDIQRWACCIYCHGCFGAGWWSIQQRPEIYILLPFIRVNPETFVDA